MRNFGSCGRIATLQTCFPIWEAVRCPLFGIQYLVNIIDSNRLIRHVIGLQPGHCAIAVDQHLMRELCFRLYPAILLLLCGSLMCQLSWADQVKTIGMDAAEVQPGWNVR